MLTTQLYQPFPRLLCRLDSLLLSRIDSSISHQEPAVQDTFSLTSIVPYYLSMYSQTSVTRLVSVACMVNFLCSSEAVKFSLLTSPPKASSNQLDPKPIVSSSNTVTVSFSV